jgi:hypothetical protein
MTASRIGEIAALDRLGDLDSASALGNLSLDKQVADQS